MKFTKKQLRNLERGLSDMGDQYWVVPDVSVKETKEGYDINYDFGDYPVHLYIVSELFGDRYDGYHSISGVHSKNELEKACKRDKKYDMFPVKVTGVSMSLSKPKKDGEYVSVRQNSNFIVDKSNQKAYEQIRENSPIMNMDSLDQDVSKEVGYVASKYFQRNDNSKQKNLNEVVDKVLSGFRKGMDSVVGLG